jgi:Tfp pilus assembly protein PilF
MISQRFREKKRDGATEQRLWLALQMAQAQYREALAEFRAVVSNVPSKIPQPDSSFVLEQAGHRQRLAFQNYAEALKQFSDFVLGTRDGA